MSFAPQQNWPEYHSVVESRQIENDRSLNALQKLQRYAEIFDLVWSLKNRSENQRRVTSCEDEKLQSRAKLLLAYRNVSGPGDRD